MDGCRLSFPDMQDEVAILCRRPGRRCRLGHRTDPQRLHNRDRSGPQLPPLPRPPRWKSRQQIIQPAGCRPSRIAFAISGASNVSSRPRQTSGGFTPFARAKSSRVASTPVSNIFRHRNASASALTHRVVDPRPWRPRRAIRRHHQLPPASGHRHLERRAPRLEAISSKTGPYGCRDACGASATVSPLECLYTRLRRDRSATVRHPMSRMSRSISVRIRDSARSTPG